MANIEAQSSGTFQSSTFSETESKTGSTKSLEADFKERELDLTKDNAASPIDLECHIQAERITKILDETIYKTKICIVMPDLVKEYNTINNLISTQDMEDIIFIFEQYENPLFSHSLLNMAAMEDLKVGDVTLRNRLNPELGHLIYILNKYKALVPTVEEMIRNMKFKYSNQPDEDRQVNAQLEYLMGLEQFRDLMVTQMATTAAEELTAKINTKKLEASNNSLMAKIDEYTRTLKDENEKFEKTMSTKSEIIAKLEQELVCLGNASNMRLKKQILDSDRQMVLATRAHHVKNEMLKEEEVETKEGYNHLLNQHLLDEKNQRARRFKVETQLLSWLSKYDTEMTDKQTDLDDYTNKYEDEKKRCEELEKEIAEQDIEYLPLMEERELEYHQEMAAKMNAFLQEHAARVIQNAWREVLLNRQEKKRLRRQIIKMRKERARQAKLAEAVEKARQKAVQAAQKAAQKAAESQKKK